MYGLAAWELSSRWVGDAVVFGVAAAAQLVALGARGLVPVGRARVLRATALLSLLLVLVVYARFIATILHVYRVFGPVTGKQALAMVGPGLAALPWLIAFPIARLLPLRARSALLLLALLPVAEGLRPYRGYDGGDAIAPTAAALWSAWNGEDASLPTLPPDAIVRVTPVRAGEAREGLEGTPAELLGRVGRLAAPGPGDALLVDLRVLDLPRGFLRPGSDAPLATGARSPALTARRSGFIEALPGFRVPGTRGETARFASALASRSGVVTLTRAWAPGPEPATASLDAAVLAGARHLLTGQQTDGRFTYVVGGPDGRPRAGYNYPRHAGTAWFLARVAAATGDAAAAAGADRALAHLRDVTATTGDGRSYVLDPAREDGKAWIGTTSLALGALALRGGDAELLAQWAAQVAGSVDADGKVRGDMTIATGVFPDQPANAYGQGQAMLALAIAERVGITTGRAALDRAIAYLDGDYLGTAHPAVVGDEHWTCLAASAIREVRGGDAGAGICAAYVADRRWDAPRAGAGLPPAVAGAAGGAEAVVARAWRTGDAALVSDAVDWARHFLAAQYREADAPLLGDPAALIGGFRSTLAELDVQIDTVQHVGCALLGVEALLAGRARPGSLP